MIKMSKFGSTTYEQIREIEKRYSIKLPEDYKRFLMETDGGRLMLTESNAIEIPDLGVSVHADIFFGCNINIKEVNLFFWMDQFQEDILEHVLLIGDSVEPVSYTHLVLRPGSFADAQDDRYSVILRGCAPKNPVRRRTRPASPPFHARHLCVPDQVLRSTAGTFACPDQAHRFTAGILACTDRVSCPTAGILR